MWKAKFNPININMYKSSLFHLNHILVNLKLKDYYDGVTQLIHMYIHTINSLGLDPKEEALDLSLTTHLLNTPTGNSCCQSEKRTSHVHLVARSSLKADEHSKSCISQHSPWCYPPAESVLPMCD